MDFTAHGFLASPQERDRSSLAAFSTQIDLAIHINATAMRLMWELEVPPKRRDLAVGALLFIRAIRSYQASLVLLQQGLAIESQALARQIIECVLRIAMLETDPSFVESMEGESQRHRITQAEKLVDIERDPELVELYRELAVQRKPDRAADYEQIARKVGLEPLYHALYRGDLRFRSTRDARGPVRSREARARGGELHLCATVWRCGRPCTLDDHSAGH